MSKKNIFSIIKVTIFSIVLSIIPSVFSQNSKFTVVIDAGHGGHDPGAIGKITREKDINLAVSLQLGELITSNYDDVKVVFTRKTDKYLTLQERANIVNANHADLFVCIHTNSAKSSSATGAESFTLGLAKTQGNLDVAMRENAVMLLEDDYKTKYKGFDPSSVDSYIMFEFMQNKYMDRSISFASDIQNQFKNFAGRSDRGVRQAGFWVLYQSACPSVLIELGFISNATEEKYLASNEGQTQLAEAIYKAFVSFKYEYDKKSGKTKNEPSTKKLETDTDIITDSFSKSKQKTGSEASNEENTELKNSELKDTKTLQTVPDSKPVSAEKNQNVAATEKPVYKLQILSQRKKLHTKSAKFKGIRDADFYVENGIYKYTIGADTNYETITNLRKEKLSLFPDAFIVAFLGKKKIPINEALILTNKNK